MRVERQEIFIYKMVCSNLGRAGKKVYLRWPPLEVGGEQIESLDMIVVLCSKGNSSLNVVEGSWYCF